MAVPYTMHDYKRNAICISFVMSLIEAHESTGPHKK